MEASQSVLCDLSLTPALVCSRNQGDSLLFRTLVLNLSSYCNGANPIPVQIKIRGCFFFRNQEPFSFTFTLMHIYGRKSMGLEL